jgi:hypothetical protein
LDPEDGGSSTPSSEAPPTSAEQPSTSTTTCRTRLNVCGASDPTWTEPDESSLPSTSDDLQDD